MAASAPLQRRGTVFIAWLGPDGRYAMYWDATPDDAPALLEEGPDTDSTEVALAWARRRADRIVIRPKENSSESYWAGTAPCPDDATPYEPTR